MLVISFMFFCPSPLRLVENATDTYSSHVKGLLPFTQYLFRVVVSHTHGQTAGPWAALHTAEDSKYTYSTHTHTQVKCTCQTERNYYSQIRVLTPQLRTMQKQTHQGKKTLIILLIVNKLVIVLSVLLFLQPTCWQWVFSYRVVLPGRSCQRSSRVLQVTGWQVSGSSWLLVGLCHQLAVSAAESKLNSRSLTNLLMVRDDLNNRLKH